jgi:hypothetical protein
VGEAYHIVHAQAKEGLHGSAEVESDQLRAQSASSCGGGSLEDGSFRFPGFGSVRYVVATVVIVGMAPGGIPGLESVVGHRL